MSDEAVEQGDCLAHILCVKPFEKAPVNAIQQCKGVPLFDPAATDGISSACG
jgi:hypothetical protein